MPPSAQGPADGNSRSDAPADTTWSNLNLRRLIFEGTDYVIYVDKDGHFNWQTSERYAALMAPNQQDYQHSKSNTIINQSELLQASLSEGLPQATKDQAYDLIGAALTSCLEFDYESAERMLATAQAYIQTRNEEMSRYWYLSATFYAAASVVAICLAVFALAAYFPLLQADGWQWAVLASAAGAIGALLSVISRSGRLSFDPAAGKKLHTLEAASRIIAGALSGAIVYAAIKSGIILSPLFPDGANNAVIMLGALAGGAAERLASSIITTFELPRPPPAHTTPARSAGG